MMFWIFLCSVRVNLSHSQILGMKAVALFSSGLDSILAVKLVQNQGVLVTALHFELPFIQRKATEDANAIIKKAALSLGTELKIVFLGEQYLQIIKSPKYGYGRNLNPCLDCKIFMFKKAKELMPGIGASFIVTGEVLGQRAKSQTKQSFQIIEKASGLQGNILRPLSAKLLPQTLAEQEGWIKREKLHDVYGRARTQQIKLAQQLGIEKYPQPSGGCLLTEAHFCKRVKDLIENEELNINNVKLLKLGRHFRLSLSFKLIVGRDEKENNQLKKFVREGDVYFEPQDLPGPSGLGRGLFDENIKLLSARIIAKYISPAGTVKIRVEEGKKKEIVFVERIDEESFKQFMI